jgi:uncharacterized protein (DUF1501 family)/uncharacterized protein (DUF1800 family)
MEVPGTIRWLDDTNGPYWYSDPNAGRRFSASLPKGNYEAYFVDENGVHAWPTYAEEYWQKEPDCSGYATPGDVTLIKPEINATEFCADLIRGMDQDSFNTTEPWIHTMFQWWTQRGIQVGEGLGVDGSDALVSYDRNAHWSGFGQDIDSRCLEEMVGEYYEFTAYIKITQKGAQPQPIVANINTDDHWWRNKSPLATFTRRLYHNEASKETMYWREDFDKVQLARPYSGTDWNILHGIVRLPRSFRAFFEIERFPDHMDMIVSKVSFTKMTCDRDQLLCNGDVETGNSKCWDSWGGDTRLHIVDGVGEGSALKASQRGHYSHGQAQVINTDCVENEGDRLAFQGRIKFLTAGTDTSAPCDPFSWNNDWSQGLGRCSDILIYTDKAGVREYHRVAEIVTEDEYTESGWYHIHGLWPLRPNQVLADYTKIYLDGISTAFDVVVDDVQVTALPFQCDALVENPSFKQGSSYYKPTDRHNRMKLSLHSPGADGASDYALRASHRDHNYRGIHQRLDARCFVVGEEYTIASKFLLLNGTSGEGVSCNVNDQNYWSNSNCPFVGVYGRSCSGGNVDWRFWNALDDISWDPNNYNDFGATMVVNEQLASCGEVYLYVHYVNRDYDIVVDDLQISKYQTEAPTKAPTPPPTDSVILDNEETTAPTTSPTSSPTVSVALSCPDEELSPTEVPSGPVMLVRSNALCILTKAIPDANDGSLSSIAPVALSYDGNDWEAAAGDFAMTLLHGQDFGHYGEGSQIFLPVLDDGVKYYLTSYSHTMGDVDQVAKLLEAATFGPTAANLQAWNDSKGSFTKENAKLWIQEQMALPKTSHRAFFRRRVNQRFTNSMGIGRSNHPCDPMSRWRKFTFSRNDGDQWWMDQHFNAVFDATTDEYIAIKLNGHVRTAVQSLAFPAGSKYTLEFNREYEMCGHPAEYEGGTFRLRVNETSGECQSLSNPLVHFYPNSVQPAQVLNLPEVSDGVLEHIDELQTRGGEYILVNGLIDDACNQLPDVTEEKDAPIFGKLPDGSWLQFDPRIKLEENTPDPPIPDGGGMVRALTGERTRCSNAPRTFLNEEHCSLSDSITACGSAGTPSLMIDLNSENIIQFHNITGQYVYAVLGLPVTDTFNTSQPWPCEPGLRSRWEIIDVSECTPTDLGQATNASLYELLLNRGSSDENIYLRDIDFPITGETCDSTDNTTAEMEIIIGSQCFRRVHPDHMNVYDFTYWTLLDTHPGNMDAMMVTPPHHNPITKWMDVNGSAFLVYPAEEPPPDHPTLAAHPISRWDNWSPKFSRLGRFGDAMKFVDLPNEIRLNEVAQHFGGETEVGGGGIMVCGSPNEVHNDPSLDQVFTAVTGRDLQHSLWRQREHTWTNIALSAEDQLCQKNSWFLAQLLVIARVAIGVQGSHSEVFNGYYDIFTRNCFGNYRDILKEISFHPLMAENLSFLQSKSSAYVWEKDGKVQFADENFAREIMQLFSTGLDLLNIDGTPKLDENGLPIPAYGNDVIMSFARAWTGFDWHQGRGNVEESSWSGNRHDPMKIYAPWRDKFPKTDMTGGYIGDGYPLCVDLPDKMFLRKGAVYRLLGSSHMPELMEDDPNFANHPIKKFVLASNSTLRSVLCNQGSNGSCQFENNVALIGNIDCAGQECNVDTVRVVEVGEGIHYEYVRPACVEQVFYADAKKVINKDRMSDSSCANPLLPYASEACCEGQHDLVAERYTDYVYDQERVTYPTAGSRCSAMGLVSCDFNSIEGIENYQKGYHWTTDGCKIQVKVSYEGQVALVYEPETYQKLHYHVKDDNRNFFKVYWDDGNWPTNDNDVTAGNSCGNGACQNLTTGGCLCDTIITESRIFEDMPSSVDEVLSKLTVGAFDTSAYDDGTYMDPMVGNGVTAYLSSTTQAFDTKTVFEVADKFGRIHRFRNTKERVQIAGATEYAFRQATSFMSVLNTEADARDAYYETEAVLDHYFYHENTAPFIAFRMIQRYGTSNPNPRYVKAVATAFQTGSYEGIGSGNYGDLAAATAAVLLHSEFLSQNLEANPFKGSLREPIVKLTHLMRAMELELAEGQSVVQMVNVDTRIGQMAHNFPTVFSFFLPEFKTGGRLGDASLVAPEGMIWDAPKAVGLHNAMFSLVNFGLSSCQNGVGTAHNCYVGDYSRATAHLSFSRPYDSGKTMAEQAEEVVGELSTLLTSGRLSPTSKETIKEAYISKLNDASAVDPPAEAPRLAQALVLTTPEFQTTNHVNLTGEVREPPLPPSATGEPYRAIVYLMFGGGCDSYNMLVPHTCSGEKDMYAEYKAIRDDIALFNTSLRLLNPVDNQICETFGVHPELPTVQRLFNDGDLLFFANAGVLTKETDRENYWRDTVTNLFAHNWMQLEAMRIDPIKKEDGTGILGRIGDVLTKKGLSVGAFSLDTGSISLIGEPGIRQTPMILSNGGVTQYHSPEGMDDTIASLNGKTAPESSGLFGEWYSDTLMKSLSNNQLLYDTISTKTTNVTFPNSHLGRQLAMVSKMIDTRAERGTDADVFYISKGGWDTHSQVLDNQVTLFADVDASFKAFSDEMKAKSVWDNVALIEVSDFARTLTPNTGAGSDHAWGGNYMLMGGSVKGSQIKGDFPDGLIEGSPLNIGRGRIIPTTSWDAVFLPLAEWAGVGEDDFDYVFPNRGNFPASHFFDMTDLFHELV